MHPRTVRGATASARETTDCRELVEEVREELAGEGHPAALTLVFCAPTLDRTALGAALKDWSGESPVMACTTAGEITPQGTADDTVTALAFDGSHFVAAVGEILDLGSLSLEDGTELVRSLRERLDGQPPPWRAEAESSEVAVLLIDGLSRLEERTLALLTEGLGDTPLVGGSAADALRLETTGVLAAGALRRGAASLALLRTDLPVHTFKTEHFVLGERRIVVTGAVPSERTVLSLDGRPAAEEYPRFVGLFADDLVPETLARHPVAIRVGGLPHLRSLCEVLPGGGLSFYCAMDEGLILHDTHAIDIVSETERALEEACTALGGPPSAVLAFDCIQRRQEIERLGAGAAMDDLLTRHRVVGFRTYGEQFGRLHINLTFSAVAFGTPRSGEGAAR